MGRSPVWVVGAILFGLSSTVVAQPDPGQRDRERRERMREDTRKIRDATHRDGIEQRRAWRERNGRSGSTTGDRGLSNGAKRLTPKQRAAQWNEGVCATFHRHLTTLKTDPWQVLDVALGWSGAPYGERQRSWTRKAHRVRLAWFASECRLPPAQVRQFHAILDAGREASHRAYVESQRRNRRVRVGPSSRPKSAWQIRQDRRRAEIAAKHQRAAEARARVEARHQARQNEVARTDTRTRQPATKTEFDQRLHELDTRAWALSQKVWGPFVVASLKPAERPSTRSRGPRVVSAHSLMSKRIRLYELVREDRAQQLVLSLRDSTRGVVFSRVVDVDPATNLPTQIVDTFYCSRGRKCAQSTYTYQDGKLARDAVRREIFGI